MQFTEFPFRSLLFVPGNKREKIQKAWQLGADCVILDLEDGVPEAEKASAREIIQKALRIAPDTRPLITVRINSPTTSYWRDDLAAVMGAPVKGLMLPKCSSAEDVIAIDHAVCEEEKNKGLREGGAWFLLLIESARALLELPRLVEASRRVVGLALGAEDFCLDMGIARTVRGAELFYARWRLAVCARAYSCLALDAIYSDFNDSKGLVRDARAAMRIGFSGKLAIHPKQIDAIHRVFMPQERDIVEAENVISAFTRAQGAGVVAIDGRMIDKPVLERARRTLALAGKAVGGSSDKLQG